MSSAMDAHLESASSTIAQLRSDPHLSKDRMQQLFSQLRIQIAAAEQAIEAEKEFNRSPVPAFKAALERRIDALHQQFDFEAAAKPSAKHNGLAKLRRAHEAVAIEAAKLDKLNTELLNVANYDWATWSQAGLASAVVSVSVGLWDTVDVADLGGSTQQLLEFGEYLKNVATAAVLMDTEEKNVVRQSQTVESIVAVAYILFYVYRDLGSSLSLIQSLEDARITRLSSVWDLVRYHSFQSPISNK
ncbi:hypothetical protein HDU99_000834 [Rhizoclosmatium hyalinum]|nr:hypothetical protein HDU99_000834 [Rhizoclosmatium hyalinum]